MRQSKNGSPSPRLLSNLVQLQMNYDLPVCVYRPQNASRCKSPWQLVSLSPVSRDLWCVFVSFWGNMLLKPTARSTLCRRPNSTRGLDPADLWSSSVPLYSGKYHPHIFSNIFRLQCILFDQRTFGTLPSRAPMPLLSIQQSSN